MEQTTKQTIKEHSYKLGDLAKLDESQNLGLTLLKPHNPNALRGSAFDILLVNQTNLIVRREWACKSELLVIIPEKLIYKIFNEQTGKCIFDPNKEFMDDLPDRMFNDDGTLKESDPRAETPYEQRNYWERSCIELDEHQRAYIGHEPNDTSINKFFKNLNHGTVAKDIRDSVLMYGKRMFSEVKREWDYDISNYKYVWRFNGLPFSIDTLKARQLVCLYYKHPAILRSETQYSLNQSITVDQLKLSLKLLLEYPHFRRHIEILETRERIFYPNNEPITDINILRRVFNSIPQKIESWNRNEERELKTALHFLTYSIIESDYVKYETYLKEVEFYTLSRDHYVDIIKQAKELNNDKIKNRYPANWLTFENKVRQLYSKHLSFIKSKREFTYSEVIESLEHITAIDNKDYEYIIKLPRTYGEIIEEGQAMNHCVGGYADGIFNSERVVLFLRNKKKPDKSYGTIDLTWTDKDNIKTYEINQAKAQSNQNLPIEVISYLRRYLELKKLKGVKEYYVRNAIDTGEVDEWEKAQIERKLAEKQKVKENELNTIN